MTFNPIRPLGLCAICLLATPFLHAVEWRGLDNQISGPKLTAADLEGKVVLVDEWGTHCGPCLALLPRMEQLWRAYRSKPFILLGSERQGSNADEIKKVVRDNNLTYPVFSGAGLASGEPNNGGGIPVLYVVNARGKVIYAGRDERAATAAFVDALSTPVAAEGLLGDVEPKIFKTLCASLAFGRSVETAMKRWKSAAEGRDAEKAKEAKALLQAITEARDEQCRVIERELKTRPCAAAGRIKAFAKTWPSDEHVAGFKTKSAEIAAKPGFAKIDRLVTFLQKLKNFQPRNSGEAKRASARAKDVLERSRSLGEGEGALAAEAKECLDGIQREIERLASSAGTAKRR